MLNNKKIVNIGIFAHVDAGKTTLTEQLLYLSGSIRKPGRVDEGTAHTDSMEVERKRGISVRSAAASIIWGNTKINIIDTPGHIDFSAEVERALQILDGAILVVSAVEGVQSQTEAIWRALRAVKLPTIIFINKIDRSGSDIKKVLNQTRCLLTEKAIPIQDIIGECEKGSRVFSFYEEFQNETNSDIYASLRNSICDKLSEFDDVILEKLVYNEEITNSDIENSIKDLTKGENAFPILFGAALNGIGVASVLDAVEKYLPCFKSEASEKICAIAYKIEHDKAFGKLVYVRMYEGRVNVRDSITNQTRNSIDKINRIRCIAGSGQEDTNCLGPGDIGILFGLDSVKIGDVLGNTEVSAKNYKIAEPMLTVQVFPKNTNQLDMLVEVLYKLEEEDPLLNVKWLAYERELHVRLMGMIQMEILTSILKSRFGLEVVFEKPTVIYKETPASKAVGYVKMKTPYFATLEMQVEPLPRGSGVVYESAYTTDFIFPRFQNEVRDAVPDSLREGVYGWQVTDVKVLLIGGRSIQLATKPSDFRAVTPIVAMKALKNAGSMLLEPILEYEVKVLLDEAGTVIGDLINMRAKINEQLLDGDFFIVKGEVPMATSFDYAARLNSFSKGRCSLKTKFLEYRECPLELGRVRERKTVDPSDVERYILSISSKSMKDNAASNRR